MKILFAMPYVPIPPTAGSPIRTYHLLKAAILHHEVSVVSFGWAENEAQLRREFGPALNVIRIVPRPWTRKLRRIAQLYSLAARHSFFYLLAHTSEMKQTMQSVAENGQFDIIHTEFSHMAGYDLRSPAVRVLNTHNVEYEIFRQMWVNARSPLRKLLYHEEFRKFRNEELRACRQHDAVLVTSDRDKIILDADVPEVPKYVVPNGVDTAYFHPSPDPSEPHSLIFTGTMSYLPNSDGALYFLDEVFPRVIKEIPDAKVYLVGRNPPRQLALRSSDNVIVTGSVEDVRPFVYRSSVFIVPLRMGSGTRLKVLEALAMKKAIVTTPIGCEGIDVRHGESALIAERPEDFADAVVQLLRNASLRQRLVGDGYDLVKASYDWSVVGNRLLDVYNRLVRPQVPVAQNQIVGPEE